MAAKKSRKIFTEDLSAFKDFPRPPSEENIKRSSPRLRSTRKNQSAQELETLIKNLQALGFKITPPSTAEDQQRQDSSLEKLGFVDNQPKKSEFVSDITELKCHLGTQHVIGGQVYGPGEVVLEPGQHDLLRTLMYQDQLSRNAHLDTAQYNPIPRSFLIKPGNGLDKYNKYRKQEVSAAQLLSATDNDQDFTQVSVTAGQWDAAGFNPSFESQTREF